MLDNQNNAQNVLLGAGIQSFTGAVSNYDGADFYKLQQNTRGSVFISGYGFNGNLDVSIFDSSFKLLASSNNPGSSSESLNINLDPGAYFVKVERSALNKDPLFTGSPYKLSFANDPLFRNIDDKNPNGQMFYTGDFNGDGVQDAFRQERGNWVDGVKDAEVIMGKASGGYDAPIQVSNLGLFEGNRNRLTFGDFNGDGKTDIIRQGFNSGASSTQFVSFQNGNFQVVGNVPDMAMMNGDFTNLIAGDFNGDGKTDLIRQEKGAWVNGSRDAELYISNGTFGWASQTVLTNAFAVNGNDTLLVAGDYIAGGGQDLMRIETTSSLINGVNDLQFLNYQGGNMVVVSNAPTNIAPQALIINGIKSSYDVNSTLTIDPSFVTDTNGWQDLTKVDFWLTDAQSKRVELADVSKFTVNAANSAKFNYSTSLSGIAVGNYKLNAIAYDKAGTSSNLFTQSITINPVFTLGFNGTNINTAYINTFNQVNGTQILGKATGNVRGIAGGTVQDFERGSIFQSTAGTFALQGTLNNFYKDLSASDKIRLGLPTATETSMGGYWHQAFQNGELQLVQGAPVKWSNQTLINERFTLLGGATSLGNAVGAIRTVNGAPVQDYDKDSIVVVGNSTVAILGSISTYYRANSGRLGLPTSEEITTIATAKAVKA
jgi:FG-GAP-like repeat